METTRTQEQLDAVAFVGQTLGPFFSQDPKQGDAGGLYRAFSQLDVEASATEWPFAAQGDALEALQQMSSSLAQGIDGICEEYRRLFVGPAKKAAPPWGSVYTDHEGVIFGSTALDLHEWLSSKQVVVTADDRLPDDHIGRMLELMAWIAHKRPEVLDDYLRLHLLTWAGHFFERVMDESRDAFFTGLAKLSSCTLSGIQAEFCLQVEIPKFYR